MIKKLWGRMRSFSERFLERRGFSDYVDMGDNKYVIIRYNILTDEKCRIIIDQRFMFLPISEYVARLYDSEVPDQLISKLIQICKKRRYRFEEDQIKLKKHLQEKLTTDRKASLQFERIKLKAIITNLLRAEHVLKGHDPDLHHRLSERQWFGRQENWILMTLFEEELNCAIS